MTAQPAGRSGASASQTSRIAPSGVASTSRSHPVRSGRSRPNSRAPGSRAAIVVPNLPAPMMTVDSCMGSSSRAGYQA